MYLLCMIKARIRWCTCRVENVLTLGKLLSLWLCFLLLSILFFISQTSYCTYMYKIISSYELARPVMGTIFLVIGECGSTLYVGLSRIIRDLIQKSMGWDHTFLSIFSSSFFLGMSRAGVNTKDAMKKQIRRIHSVFSHVDP